MNLTRSEADLLFAEHVKNVRYLKAVYNYQNHKTNKILASKGLRGEALEFETKIQALILSALLESSFGRLVTIPHGLSESEINEVLRTVNSQSILDGWKKLIDLALKRVNPSERSGEIPNMRQKLLGFLDGHLGTLITLRNKIAHGQWLAALNSGATRTNTTLSDALRNLTVIDIHVRYQVATLLIGIVDAMIASPQRNYRETYWEQVAVIEEVQARSVNHTVQSKRAKLLAKARRA